MAAKKRPTARKAASRKKIAGRKSGARKKTTLSKATVRKKTGGRKKTASHKKTTGKKPSTRKYGKRSAKKVERAMHEMHEGKLTSGRSGKKVTSRKQAIAIGLSEARKEGDKVPKPK